MQQFLKDLFPELAPDQELIEEIERRSSVREVEKGTIIIDYGSYIHFVPLVVKGLVKVMRENSDGKEVLLYFLAGGSTCAATFSCCMVRKRSEVKAIAEEDTTIIMIPLEAADEWMGKYTKWRNFVMTMYDQRLFAMIDTVDKLAFSKLDEKLWDYLTERVLYTDNNTVEVSHQEIADDLNASREAISRLLKKLENQEKIKIHRNKIELLGQQVL